MESRWKKFYWSRQVKNLNIILP